MIAYQRLKDGDTGRMDGQMMENILEYDSGLIAARLERSEKALVTGVSFRLSAGKP